MLSNFQSRVLKLLPEVLGSAKLKTEVNVKKLFPSYAVNNQHYDIVITSYRMIIECHGEQHRILTSFGKQDTQTAVTNFATQKSRDRNKEEIARLNGWNYLCIWQSELPTKDEDALVFLKNNILRAIKETSSNG